VGPPLPPTVSLSSQVHVFLKRTVYVPARQLGVGPHLAALLTFASSGLLHEYNFMIHNAPAFEPGHASSFFVLMGALALAEAAAAKMAPLGVLHVVNRCPSFVIAVAIQLPVLPLFGPLFMRSWIAAGMLDSVAEMIPHLHCH
jgi:hypothetical protein